MAIALLHPHQQGLAITGHANAVRPSHMQALKVFLRPSVQHQRLYIIRACREHTEYGVFIACASHATVARLSDQHGPMHTSPHRKGMTRVHHVRSIRRTPA